MSRFRRNGACQTQPPAINPIRHVIAVDGGYAEVAVQKKFPSATVCFFQFGVLKFAIEDLESIGTQAFIDPDDIAKLKRIERLKLIIPVRNVTSKGESTLTQSVRRAVYDFYVKNPLVDHLIDTLKWLLYREYASKREKWDLSSCPSCEERTISLERSKIKKDHTFDCPKCRAIIYLTDTLRLHESVDDELGAGRSIGLPDDGNRTVAGCPHDPHHSQDEAGTAIANLIYQGWPTCVLWSDCQLVCTDAGID